MPAARRSGAVDRIRHPCAARADERCVASVISFWGLQLLKEGDAKRQSLTEELIRAERALADVTSHLVSERRRVRQLARAPAQQQQQQQQQQRTNAQPLSQPLPANKVGHSPRRGGVGMLGLC